jgi:2,3-bisphosphoglycerate-independent phosphoglycerate mutase
MRGTDRRILWLVLDGMADRPAADLDGQTPLEAAATPNLDRLAAAGQNGTMDVSRPGTPLSSDRAHSLLFGYDLAEVPGRGVLEARGFDVSVPAGAVACSASFGRVSAADDGWTVTDRHLRDVSADYAALAERVADLSVSGVDVGFTDTWKNRGVVVLDADGGLSAEITDVDPFACGLPVVWPQALSDAAVPDAARRTGAALAAYTRWTGARLDGTPVDVVLSKWAGTPTGPPAFRDRHGLGACSLTSKPVLTGLARTLDMTVRDPAADYGARADGVLAAVDGHEFVHAHYPEPDEVSHAAGPAAKRDEL